MSTEENGGKSAGDARSDQAKPAQANKAMVTPLEATIELARRGRKEIIPRLRKVLAEHPELWTHFGDLAVQVREKWLGLIAGKDLYLAECLRLHLDRMRADLAGPNPRPLEQLLINHILGANVRTLYFEALDTQAPQGENVRLAEFRMRRQDQAHRQFLSAVKMLATVRQLAARTIQVELIQRPPHGGLQVPIIKGVNGEEPGVARPVGAGVHQASGNAAPAVGYHRLNGKVNGHCSRIAGLGVG